jgi:hypothetical protein
MAINMCLLGFVLFASAAGHGMVGYIQKEGSNEVCTMRLTRDAKGADKSDGNYGPDQKPGVDACGEGPGTAKKVLKYIGDGTDLKSSAIQAGAYWLNPQEMDANCEFAPGDRINAYVHISGNHGGRTADGLGAWWSYQKLEGNVAFQKIQGSETDYDINGPIGTHGHRVESFVLPSELEAGWYTLRWEWHAPGGLHFVHCVDATISGSATQPSPQPQPAFLPPTPPLVPLPAPTSQPSRAQAPSPQPSLVPAPAPSGDCVSSGPAYYTTACAALAASCEQHSFCKRVPAGSSTPSIVAPSGACVSNDPNFDYSATCKALEAMCEQYSFCKRASSVTQTSAMLAVPVHRLRRLRRSMDHVLFQGSTLHAHVDESYVTDYTDEDHSDSVTSHSEL